MANGQGWWGLKNVIDANRQEQAAYNAQPPDACPNDGTPLETGRDGTRNCPMGDYRYTGGTRVT